MRPKEVEYEFKHVKCHNTDAHFESIIMNCYYSDGEKYYLECPKCHMTVILEFEQEPLRIIRKHKNPCNKCKLYDPCTYWCEEYEAPMYRSQLYCKFFEEKESEKEE